MDEPLSLYKGSLKTDTYQPVLTHKPDGVRFGVLRPLNTKDRRHHLHLFYLTPTLFSIHPVRRLRRCDGPFLNEHIYSPLSRRKEGSGTPRPDQCWRFPEPRSRPFRLDPWDVPTRSYITRYEYFNGLDRGPCICNREFVVTIQVIVR